MFDVLLENLVVDAVHCERLGLNDVLKRVSWRFTRANNKAQ